MPQNDEEDGEYKAFLCSFPRLSTLDKARLVWRYKLLCCAFSAE